MATFLGKLQTLEASGLLRVLVGVWTPLMTIHPVRDAGVSMTFLTASVAVSPPSEVSTHSCLSRPTLATQMGVVPRPLHRKQRHANCTLDLVL